LTKSFSKVILGLVEKLNPAQLKSLSEFANTVAAAWFTAGVISPFFTKPKSFFFAAIVTSLFLIAMYFMFKKKK